MALKMIIGIIIVLLFGYAGRMAAVKIVHLADGIRNLQEDLKRLRNQTIEKRLSANEALSALDGAAFGRMRMLLKENKSITLKGAWEKSGGAGEELAEENGLVSMLFDSLERLGRQQQEKEYERVLEDLKRMEEKRRKEGKEKMGLYTSLGALTGLCAVIFLV